MVANLNNIDWHRRDVQRKVVVIRQSHKMSLGETATRDGTSRGRKADVESKQLMRLQRFAGNPGNKSAGLPFSIHWAVF